MAHAHLHPGESARDYFTEQLLGLLVCGGLGFVAVMMYRNGMLNYILAKPFHLPVLYGGLAILGVIVVLRGIAIWREAGALQALNDQNCNHAPGQAHGPECNHNPLGIPLEDDHDHVHNHDLSWVFVTMLVLVVPITLFIIGMPSQAMQELAMKAEMKLDGRNSGDEGISGVALAEMRKDATLVEEKNEPDGSIVRILKSQTGLMIREVVPPGGGEPKLSVISQAGMEMRFNDLNDAAYDERKRGEMQGTTAILEGRFKRLADKEFTLFRLKMTCCAADTIPLKVRIVVPQAVSGYIDFDWVRVKGVIQFLKVPNQERYVPVILVSDIADVKKVPPKNEYE
ncbi:MAG: hypothetical protein L0241_03980 [Planctomycetia bacterium]|nr:hypothetical protein [Planctomycetia bacterium]